jgi:DNA-binding CsgD family transcriptional regulator
MMKTSSIKNSRAKATKTAFQRAVRVSAPISPVDNLIRKLVAHATRVTDSGACGGDKSRKVIFDAEFDGMHCLVVREPKTTEARVSCTPREREIARMVAKGYPNKAIAAVLEISSWTVGTHLRHMFAKLGVSSRAAMVARMIESGLINFCLILASCD